jgi:anti-sigma B factor antagonist
VAEFRIESHDVGGVTHVMLGGEFDLAGIQQFESVLGKLEAERPETLVIDLSGLDFMDSSGLRALVMADQRARSAGRRLAIVPGPPPVRRVFEITQLDDRLDLIDSVSAL